MNELPEDGKERTPKELTTLQKDLLHAIKEFIKSQSQQKERRNYESQSYGSEEQTGMD